MKKNLHTLFICFLTLPLFAFTVVIDAGHGGHDSGAVGRKLKEKDINLSVSLMVGALIKKNMSDVRVIYTRDDDTFVDLSRRASIANKAKADLFISIHTNAAKNRSAYGTETYTLGFSRSKENLEVAKRENSVILLEDNFSQRYEGFDPNSTESYIMFEFLQDRHMEQSINMASLIQSNFKRESSRVDRGVRQAGFLVLRATGMPSVLVELGYISNSEEEAYLSSRENLQSLSGSIYYAFCNYKSEIDRKQKGSLNASANSKDSSVSNQSKSTAEKEESLSSAPKSMKNNEPSEGVMYKIQLLTSPIKLKTVDKRFHKLTPIDCYIEKGMFKYTYLNTRSKKEVERELVRVRKFIKDAFIISFKNGEKQ